MPKTHLPPDIDDYFQDFRDPPAHIREYFGRIGSLGTPTRIQRHRDKLREEFPDLDDQTLDRLARQRFSNEQREYGKQGGRGNKKSEDAA